MTSWIRTYTVDCGVVMMQLLAAATAVVAVTTAPLVVTVFVSSCTPLKKSRMIELSSKKHTIAVRNIIASLDHRDVSWMNASLGCGKND